MVVSMGNKKVDSRFPHTFASRKAVIGLISITRFGGVRYLPGPRLGTRICPITLFEDSDLRRRQQVEGFGYRSGRSFHPVPVLKIHSIPSNTGLSSVLGRPPFRPTDLFGMRGSISRYCSSVQYTTPSLTGLPPASQICTLSYSG